MSLLLIISSILLRLLPHLPNFTPLGASALFSGANFNKKCSVIITMSALLIGDYLLLYVNPFSTKPFDFSTIYSPIALFHSTTTFVYLSFLIYSLIGIWISHKKSINRILLGSVIASLQFFLITNFGVWATGMYGRGLDGLLQSYIMGLPFFKYTILGDLFYSTLFFGAYEIARKIIPKPKPALEVPIA
ncbi:hypothetical protein HYU92_05200 [Candidatus Curtissbacteria bacterium]|nr:hypothetical protein [Candidatus Curtissbacteria bacterium]